MERRPHMTPSHTSTSKTTNHHHPQLPKLPPSQSHDRQKLGNGRKTGHNADRTPIAPPHHLPRRRGPQREMLHPNHVARGASRSRQHRVRIFFLPRQNKRRFNEKQTALTIDRSGRAGTSAFFAWPLLGPLLFENETSDARDHCANERSTSLPFPPAMRTRWLIAQRSYPTSVYPSSWPSCPFPSRSRSTSTPSRRILKDAYPSLSGPSFGFSASLCWV